MESDLRTRISDIIIEHEIFDQFKDGWECSCGDNRRFADHNFQSWDEHLADAVIRELGNLRQEPHRFQCGSDDCIRYRIISDWTPNE